MQSRLEADHTLDYGPDLAHALEGQQSSPHFQDPGPEIQVLAENSAYGDQHQRVQWGYHQKVNPSIRPGAGGEAPLHMKGAVEDQSAK